MNARSWYLGCGPEDVGECAVLVGDRGRVTMAAELLSDPRWLNDERGLTTVTGTREGRRVTVSAFGMGAPIAALVLHELATIGVRSFVRLGTALTLPPVRIGDLVLAHGAVRGESTSRTYLPLEFPALSDPALVGALGAAAEAAGRSWVGGLIASYDGFYTQMFTPVGAPAGQRGPDGQDGGAGASGETAVAAPEQVAVGAADRAVGATGTAERAASAGTGGGTAGPPRGGREGLPVSSLSPVTPPSLGDLARLGVVGVDMETSAILTVARALGVRAASLCLGTVDGIGHDRLPAAERRDAEVALLEVGMRGLLEASDER